MFLLLLIEASSLNNRLYHQLVWVVPLHFLLTFIHFIHGGLYWQSYKNTDNFLN